MSAVLMVPYLALYLGCGLLIIHWLLPGQRALYRLWLGLCLGLVLLMWLPALVAFVLAFSLLGHLMALIPLLLLTTAAWWWRDQSRPALPWGDQDSADLRLLALFALPLTMLGVYLQYTHNLRSIQGAYYVGQSTYGDLALHTGIITSLRDARFPADYSILPGMRLSYPFLSDSLSTSFMLFGTSLQAALVIPGSLMMALVFGGYLLLARCMAEGRKAAVLAFLLLFINGGLGFIYSLDMAGVSLGSAGSNELQSGTWLGRLQTILQGWYQTPANHAEFGRYNLRWSNIIADMLIPQRSFLAGWCFLFPCLYLLWDGMRQGFANNRGLVLLGLMAGALPLIHTHSFLALGLVSAGWMLHQLFAGKPWRPWLAWGGLAVLLALPQLVFFTFRQAGGGEGFLRFQFNWVNNAGGQGMRDGYLWFYVKNIGLPFLLIVWSLFEKNRKNRLIFAGAFVIFLVSELVIFQPNEYDNNKLFYVWYALCLIPASDYAAGLWRRLKGLRARPLMAVLVAVVLFASGTLALIREGISRYQAYSQEAIALAAYVEDHTPPDSLVMASWQEHLNPVSALAGRRIVCGPDLWLYYHGFNLDERKRDISAFYRAPADNLALLQKYGVSHILLGPAERSQLSLDEGALQQLFQLVYQDAAGQYSLYEVSPG